MQRTTDQFAFLEEGVVAEDGGGFDQAARWIALSDSLDRHEIAPEAVLCPLTVIAFTSDRLVPVEDSRELAARAPKLRRLIEAPSIFGHDAFLKEREVVGRALHDALTPLYATPLREIAA